MAKKRTICAQCERNVTVCGPLSKRHLCEDCGIGNHLRHNMRLAIEGGMAIDLVDTSDSLRGVGDIGVQDVS
jgi:hypothetical protein